MLPDFKSTSSLGNHGEDLVAKFLEKNKFKVLDRNYKKRFGEIDLIACKRNLIIFVEVKLRKTKYFNLSEVITLSKQKKIIMTAKEYLVSNQCIDKIFRFDVAFVQKINNNFEIEYLENAFTETIF